MIQSEDKVQRFLEDFPEIDIVETILPDLAGGLRGKWITREKLPGLFSGEVRLPLTALTFDVWGRDIEAWTFRGGDGDGTCVADAGTLVPVPWAARPTAQVIVSMQESDGRPCAYDARHLVQSLVRRLAGHGLRAVMATEMEFYLLRDAQAEGQPPQHTHGNEIGVQLGSGQTYCLDTMADMSGLMHAIRDACISQDLPVDTLIKESAPSQYEINLLHQDDALLAADHALMLQRVIRGVARQQGMRATFMAKPFGDLSGSGLHVHCSLLDDDGNNAFDDGGDGGSVLLRRAVAGCLATMAESMLLFAPNLNSYRRFQSGTHAPLAPGWGYENRTAALRIPAGPGAGRRIEHRVSGADANPYLVIAAILAGMLYGIEQGLEPAPPVRGNAYEQLEPALPRYWPDALKSFSGSGFIRDYLGSELQQVYTLLKTQEMADFDRRITPMEYSACL